MTARSLTASSLALGALALVGCADRAALLPVGRAAPDFEAVAHDGQTVRLSALRGRYVVVYFYPRDETPGCTKEACELRDSWAPLQQAGVVVLGVSTDDAASHKAFAEHHHLPFLLLADPDGALCQKFGVPRVFGFAQRVTYLLDREGRVKQVWPSVSPVGHAAEILRAVAPDAASQGGAT